ncbi:photoreceptor ankyrin repeat protein-like isoform X2 [Cloeon dipterum]|uniref:photoreceptor ankyrin repeat protein-like isoform X2 n=1 Tax=Cloeon dipterum TaxID=197152 RepID=UPI003220887B
MSPAPNSIGGGWKARSRGSIAGVQVISEPAIKEILYPAHKSPSEMFLPRTTPLKVAPVVPRRVYTRSLTMTTPPEAVSAVVDDASVLPSRPPRRVTFDLSGSTTNGAAGELGNQHGGCGGNGTQQQAGANSVSDIAGVTNWLRSRRHNANKESFRIKIAVNRRFSSVHCSFDNVINNNNFILTQSNRNQVNGQHKGSGLRRFSSIAAIDAKKLPPTVGPPPTASNGGGCFAATSAAAISLVRVCREGDESGLQELMTGANGLQLQPSDVNCFDSSGRTPVSYIASSGSLAMLEALAQFPAVDFNYPDNEGNTPLHFAAQAGHVEVLNLLLSRCSSVEVDSRNSLGFTPLMKAALQGRTKCAKLLLFAGASPALRDLGRGFRAEQWARYCGRHMCAEVIDKFSRHRLLERAGATHPNAAVGGRWGSEPELTAQACPPQAAPPSSSGGSWLKSKLKRAFKSSPSNQDSPSKASKHPPQEPAAPPPAPASTPPLTPRVFIVPKVQVTPAGAALSSADADQAEQQRSAANARRKK